MPYRIDEEGNLQIMLVTSRSGKDHWIPPKGNLISGKTPHEAAAQEAFEEAGIVGEIASQPCGRYTAVKVRPDGTTQKITVTVFPIRVVKSVRDWPEKGQRSTLWFDPSDAAKVVRESELSRLIAQFEPTLAG